MNTLYYNQVSTLTLLMTGFNADDANSAIATNHFAFTADFLNRRSNFHF